MRRGNIRILVTICVFVALFILLLCLYSDQNHYLFSQKTNSYSIDLNFDRKLLDKDYELDLEDEDVLVFLHMQKTGGTTFGKHLVKNLDIDQPCECIKGKKKCNCLTRKQTVWLFSRYSTGWACGLHADWTELKGCVDKEMDKQEGLHRKRRFHYITILRDPVRRYISEWKHVQRGATWKAAKLYCNGRQASLEEVPFCFEGSTWKGVSLEEFIKCKFNLANNRQTRMLANLSKVNCYNGTGMNEELRQRLLLESAIENLKNMSFFGLTEHQRDTQLLFQHTFHIKFSKDFEQYNKTHSEKAEHKVTQEQISLIENLNALDVKLYKFAKRLFEERVKVMTEEMNEPESSPVSVIESKSREQHNETLDYVEELFKEAS
ncbi:Heparan-sulfate 6-O-sulfotransferase 2,Heparan-sulfate 6-O-sulfotransferase 3-B,Heparan-sulfate 6-O-sulfotransferase 1-A,Heparan-sulfate 6-O-sulfotransferase 1,Heparan-sulfate 6-O-sulfotransferase 1-B,Heparan-sulfate 6-O-sulfotransferase 3 [Mytilus coruscus]|uniref:Heparan-sulfate 6-O-sulfotransferase n=1 Tax=Mytilus coruscus TaxID=42192 RepID=A0A6J8CR25_MYTCO|nr:Heparan-sulfate 6-O-sulfotransferase 2,Heparan-sulfate 6-O-sulfotransferase 3-B,Heparan-sulfate 6-O-sulfotransferase 1-A,Heparan-sulfate 6-O-sulfotransferase 1,Heparan-sulfate 6-O-sulfotransferase 1-B,Heparan-sulfate 6-O-sulfotransferase 3 [Mytilus coruscus]